MKISHTFNQFCFGDMMSITLTKIALSERQSAPTVPPLAPFSHPFPFFAGILSLVLNPRFLLSLCQGASKRSISQTDMNEHSSRSHTIFQMMVPSMHLLSPHTLIPLTQPASVGCAQITQTPKDPSSERVPCRSKLNLVDLAGSEKWRTHATMGEKRIKELTSINQSLSTLGNCISALGNDSRTHVPFRDSKLTRLLQVSGGLNACFDLLGLMALSLSLSLSLCLVRTPGQDSTPIITIYGRITLDSTPIARTPGRTLWVETARPPSLPPSLLLSWLMRRHAPL
jgi:hypothetical protein